MDVNKDTSFKTLGDMFYHCLHRDKIFQYLDDINETTTYSDVLQWSIRTAIKLKKMGISRKDIVSSCTHNQKYTPVPFIATQFLGAICNSFDPNLSHLDTIHLLKLIEPKILFVAEESLAFMESCLEKAGVKTEIVVFGPSKKYRQFSEFIEPSEEESSFQIEKVQNDSDTAVIFFSSGTTGLPKGICLNHKTLIKASGTVGVLGNAEDKNTVIMTYTTLYWISAVFSLLRSVRFGYSCVIRVKFDPEYTWRLIDKYKISTMFLAPYHAIDFVKHKPADVDASSLDSFLVGSCAVPLKLMTSLFEILPHAKIVQGYGQTEAGSLITMFNVTSPEEYALQLKKPLSCGKMLKGFQWKIVDTETEKVLGPNQRGELRVKFDGYLMNGYYKMDSSSAFDSEGYLKTGDIMYYDDDECFYVVGRIKEIFKYRGWHILPNLIEDIILSHPAVKEAAVIGVPHEIDGEHAMAVVVLFDEYDKKCKKEIEDFVNEKVADSQKLRAGVKIVDYIPKTTTNKIRRNDLRKMIGAIKNSM
ncbi:uncharacterized protein LOC130452776 [Diorhabda sublineata]|uniref:uncharacterized protein LOC130452776 n=1 Tax=Diorhabda sublineata TaxID=1163346 RepID=UPI0024E14B6E|nr:uncharacterized protein LOC130452776 [Diorhabda sublineata]